MFGDKTLADRLSLAGECLTAGELFRRDISASFVHGGGKPSHLLITSANSIVSIAVRTTNESSWEVGTSKIVGCIATVLVRVPRDRSNSPQFFVLLPEDFAEIDRSKRNAAAAKRVGQASEGKTFRILELNIRSSRVSFEEVHVYANRWDKITDALGIGRGDWG